MTMRIKLKIHRHELPTTKIVYSLPNETLTFSAFLERINEIVPLEADGWGLDDYAVELNGFECLHYHYTQDILTAEDEVSIRPLRSSDIKARRLSGRYQINAAGAHLIDGIAFGSQYLKRPNRPPISIPPRKRRRVSYDVDEVTPQASPEGTSPRQLRIRSTFEDSDVEQIAREGQLLLQNHKEDGKNTVTRGKKRRRSVSFAESALEDEDDEDEDEEDYAPESGSDSDLISEDEISGIDVVDQDEGQSRYHANSQSPEAEGDSASSLESGSSSSSESSLDENDSPDASSDESDSEREDTSTLSNPEADKGSDASFGKRKAVDTTREDAQTRVQPGMGKKATQRRNERRKRSVKLASLISQGILPEGATGKDADDYIRNSEVRAETVKGDVVLVLESHKDDLGDDGGRSKESIDSAALIASTISEQETSKEEQMQETPIEEEPKRRKIDISSTRRMIFNSLGTRAPKNKAEEEKVRIRLAGKKPRTTTKDTHGQVAEVEQAILEGTTVDAAEADSSGEKPISDDWKGKIKLMAVECCDEGVELSTPPFPFVQRWDPKQQHDYSSKGNKRKRDSGYAERPAKASRHNQQLQDFTADAEELPLNYDDEDIAEYDQDIIRSSQEDDLPQLPENVSDLPDLSVVDLKPGAVVAFKYLELSHSTNWQPLISPRHRTALVETYDKEENLLQLTLAWRDRAGHDVEYDDDGNRIYGKFEMATDDDDFLLEEGKLDITFDAMMDAKLVQPTCDGELPTEDMADLSQTLVPNSIGMDDSTTSGDKTSQSFMGPARPLNAYDEEGINVALYDSNGTELPAAQKQDISISADSIPSDGPVSHQGPETQSSLSKGSGPSIEAETLGMVEASA